MLRAFYPGVRLAVLCKTLEEIAWRLYWKQSLKTVWRSVPEQTAQYFAWAGQQKALYIGKANVQRKTADKLGVVARFKEHVASSFKVDDANFVARRYRCWRNARPHELFLVVAAWHDEKHSCV